MLRLRAQGAVAPRGSRERGGGGSDRSIGRAASREARERGPASPPWSASPRARRGTRARTERRRTCLDSAACSGSAPLPHLAAVALALLRNRRVRRRDGQGRHCRRPCGRASGRSSGRRHADHGPRRARRHDPGGGGRGGVTPGGRPAEWHTPPATEAALDRLGQAGGRWSLMPAGRLGAPREKCGDAAGSDECACCARGQGGRGSPPCPGGRRGRSVAQRQGSGRSSSEHFTHSRQADNSSSPATTKQATSRAGGGGARLPLNAGRDPPRSPRGGQGTMFLVALLNCTARHRCAKRRELVLSFALNTAGLTLANMRTLEPPRSES